MIGIATLGYYGGGQSSGGSPPVITVVSPTPGSTIGPSTTIVFNYQDNVGFANKLPCVKILQPDGVSYKYELIHDGVNFTPDYSGTMAQISVSPQIWQYSVNRKGGWTSTIQYAGVAPGGQLIFVPFGADTSGNPDP